MSKNKKKIKGDIKLLQLLDKYKIQKLPDNDKLKYVDVDDIKKELKTKFSKFVDSDNIKPLEEKEPGSFSGEDIAGQFMYDIIERLKYLDKLRQIKRAKEITKNYDRSVLFKPYKKVNPEKLEKVKKGIKEVYGIDMNLNELSTKPIAKYLNIIAPGKSKIIDLRKELIKQQSDKIPVKVNID